MKIKIPELALVTLIGASGSGKSTFAKTHFRSTEVISSDFCRGLVSDDENNQAASKDAFDVLHYIAAKRLASGRLTVIEATNVQAEDRKQYTAVPAIIRYSRSNERTQVMLLYPSWVYRIAAVPAVSI